MQNFKVSLVLDCALVADESIHIKYRFVSKLGEIQTTAEKFVASEEWPPAHGVQPLVFYIIHTYIVVSANRNQPPEPLGASKDLHSV